jgi:hypothetical protein
MTYRCGMLAAVTTLEMTDGPLTAIRTVLNPENTLPI